MNEENQETKKVEVDYDFFIKMLKEYTFQYKEMRNRLEIIEREVFDKAKKYTNFLEAFNKSLEEIVKTAENNKIKWSIQQNPDSFIPIIPINKISKQFNIAFFDKTNDEALNNFQKELDDIFAKYRVSKANIIFEVKE